MELDKDLQARQEARQLLRQAELAQKQLADFSQEQLDAICKAMCDRFEVAEEEARQDAQEFLQQLHSVGLLEE